MQCSVYRIADWRLMVSSEGSEHAFMTSTSTRDGFRYPDKYQCTSKEPEAGPQGWKTG